MSAHTPILVSVDDARAMLGNIGKTHFYELLKAGRLETCKLGKRRLVSVAGIQALVDQALAA